MHVFASDTRSVLPCWTGVVSVKTVQSHKSLMGSRHPSSQSLVDGGCCRLSSHAAFASMHTLTGKLPCDLRAGRRLQAAAWLPAGTHSSRFERLR